MYAAILNICWVSTDPVRNFWKLLQVKFWTVLGSRTMFLEEDVAVEYFKREVNTVSCMNETPF